MNEIIKITEQNGRRAVSARELHNFLGNKAQFSDWIKDRIEKYGFIENQDFEVFHNFLKNPQGGRPLTEYALSVDMAKEISMVEGTERGKQARQYFIQCEKQLAQASLPSYQLSDPIERAQKWIQEEQHRQQLALEVKAKEEIIEQQRPKVLFAECITSSPSNILIADLAKLLTQNGITIGQNRLFDWLTDKGYLLRKQRWNNSKNAYKNEYRPSQRAMELGILSMSEHAIPNPRTGEHFTKFTCYVTGKGQQYFINKFKADSCLLAI